MRGTYRDEREQRNIFPFLRSIGVCVFCLAVLLSPSCKSQKQKATVQSPPAAAETVYSPPKVVQIDASGLQELLKPKGKPVLINFWATWCGPCREEFPDLVQIGVDHKDKVDLITVSFDDAAEIEGEVKNFLTEMNYGFPAYLLKTSDENAAIELVSKEWQGALPFTILLDTQGEAVYFKQGKFDTDDLVEAIEKL